MITAKMPPARKALILFAKEPAAGSVKTRLMPALTAEEAAQLYRCMLLDTLAKVKALQGIAIFLFYGGSAGGASVFRELAREFEIFTQEGSDLGARMMNAFSALLRQGYEQVAIIGTDAPDLPVSFIGTAFAQLDGENADCVFGPSEDGGYYLLALKKLQPELFTGIAWSSPDVLQVSMFRASRQGLKVSVLPLWYDVDTVADLHRQGLVADASTAPLTRDFLRKWLARQGTAAI